MTKGGLLLVCGCFLAFCLLYYGSAYLGDFSSHRYRLYFEWERNIPLVPAAALVYMSGGLMYLPIFARLRTARNLCPLALTLAAQLLVACLIFLIYPLEDGFGPAPPLSGFSGQAWRLAGTMAARHNYLPSLHVALATTAAMVYARAGGGRIWLMRLWAAAVALSTLLIHQHHLADVVAGLGLAGVAVVGLYDRLLPTFSPQKPAQN